MVGCALTATPMALKDKAHISEEKLINAKQYRSIVGTL